jgi:hypothetical protein
MQRISTAQPVRWLEFFAPPANFLDPTISIKVRDGISDWLDAHGCQSVQEIIGVI